MLKVGGRLVITPFIPDPLIDDIAQGRCIPFIGAGFSKNAVTYDGTTLPDWQELAAALTPSIPDNTEGLACAEIAQLYEDQFGRVGLLQRISDELGRSSPKPGTAHEALTRLPWDLIYTTNFDNLIERAYEDLRKSVVVITDDNEMSFLGGRSSLTVVKMHGDIQHRNQIVATTHDYERYLMTHPVMATHLSAMFITKSFLFIGYSLSDPNVASINRIIGQRLGNFKRRSYWIGFDVENSQPPELGGERINTISISTKNERDDSSKTDLLVKLLSTILDRVESKINPYASSPALAIRGRGFL